MKENTLDDLINDYLRAVAHGDPLKAIYLAKDIFDTYTREEVLQNLSPPSRQQTGLILWAQDYFKEQK